MFASHLETHRGNFSNFITLTTTLVFHLRESYEASISNKYNFQKGTELKILSRTTQEILGKSRIQEESERKEIWEIRKS